MTKTNQRLYGIVKNLIPPIGRERYLLPGLGSIPMFQKMVFELASALGVEPLHRINEQVPREIWTSSLIGGLLLWGTACRLASAGLPRWLSIPYLIAEAAIALLVLKMSGSPLTVFLFLTVAQLPLFMAKPKANGKTEKPGETG
jgi:hypothetical protein